MATTAPLQCEEDADAACNADVISHPGNPSMYVSKLPDLCPRLYMGACTERKLDDVRLARLVLQVPITAVLILELRNILLHGCRLRFVDLHLFL